MCKLGQKRDKERAREDKMNFRDIPMWESAIKAGARYHDHSRTSHTHFWQHAMSRRQFARTVAGTAVVGATLA